MTKWLLPEILPFERRLQTDPYNELLWLDYLEFLDSQPEKKLAVLQRAVGTLPASTLLWNAHFLACLQDKPRLLKAYAAALACFPENAHIWTKYADLAVDLAQPATEVFERALFSLPRSHHQEIWEKYVQYGETHELPAEVYFRLVASGTPISEEIIDFILQNASPKQVSRLFALLWTRSRLAMYALEAVIPKVKPSFFDQLASELQLRHPKLTWEVHMKLAIFYSDKNTAKTVHHYSCALKEANSVREVTATFNEYCEFLQSTASTEIHLLLLEKLLQDRPFFVNDVILKENPNNVDLWMQRIQSVPASDMLNRIKTYVAAISTINPLHAVGETPLVKLWIDYANIYLDQGDRKTASLIFRKASNSQFSSPDLLADVHIAWTESLLQSSDKAALEHMEETISNIPVSPESYKFLDSTQSVQSRLFLSTKLWTFYVDLLHALDQTDKLSKVYEKMMSLKIITLRLLFEYADYLQQTSPEKAISLYETALRNFKAPRAKYEIWAVYLEKLLKIRDSDTLRDAYDDCILDELPGDFALVIYEKYADFEKSQGNITKSVALLEKALVYISNCFTKFQSNYPKNRLDKMVDDKISLYGNLIEKYQNLRDTPKTREILSLATQDETLPLPRIVDFGLKFADFEAKQKESVRARALFHHISSLGKPSSHIFAPVWEAWEKFEVDFGLEATFKQMLKQKRNLEKEYAAVEEAKKEINPLNFIKGDVKGGEIQAENPDEIDVDM